MYTKHLNILELDPNKKYAILVPETTTGEEFDDIAAALKKNGHRNFIAIHDSSKIRIKEISNG